MKAAWIVAALVAIHLFLRVTLGLDDRAPDLLVVAVLVATRFCGIRAGAALGFALGLLEDAFAVLSFGASTFALTVLGAAGALFSSFFAGHSLLFLAGLFAAGKLLRDFLAWAVSEPSARGVLADYMLIESPPLALYAAVVGTAVCRLLLRRELRR